MKTIQTISAGLAAVAIVMTGCASEQSRPYNNGPYDSRQGGYDSRQGGYDNRQGGYDNRQGANDSRQASYGQGVVDRIEVVTKGAGGNIAGTIIGGIAGGLIGHQIGGGSGNTAATIAGAAGGAVAGKEIQKRRGSNETFRVTVRMDNGASEVVTQEDISDLRAGDRVRVESGRLYRL